MDEKQKKKLMENVWRGSPYGDFVESATPALDKAVDLVTGIYKPKQEQMLPKKEIEQTMTPEQIREAHTKAIDMIRNRSSVQPVIPQEDPMVKLQEDADYYDSAAEFEQDPIKKAELLKKLKMIRKQLGR